MVIKPKHVGAILVYISLLLLGAELPLMVERFGLLNDLFPFPSILDAGNPVFDLHVANILFDIIFLCTRFLLHPLNRPVPFLH